jgi:hypothetical protein
MTMLMTPPCIICEKPLSSFDEEGNQPNDGLEFFTRGHYGSTVFDPMDGSGLAINVCDDCLTKAAEKQHVLEYAPERMTRVDYKVWKP